MSEELRLKILHRQEREKSSIFAGRLPRFRVYSYHQDDIIPDWIHQEIKRINLQTSVPNSTIACDVEPDSIRRWLESFLENSDVVPRFYLYTGMYFFPWLDCEKNSSGWEEDLLPLVATGLIVVSHDRAKLAVVYEEEERFEGFASARV